MVQSCGNRDDWCNAHLALVDSRTDVGECYGKLRSVRHKEDPTVIFYGMNPYGNGCRYNTKKVRYDRDPKRNEPIDIIYDREA